jgi:F-type H+-transporting ATPase subunit b
MNINLTLFGQMIAFFFFVWFCMRMVWPPIVAAMLARQEQIAEGLETAERAKKDLSLAQKCATDEIKKARVEASEIIELARRRSEQMIEEAKREARAEGERVKAAATTDVQQEVQRAKESLRKEVAALALLGAECILERDVDAASHAEMLERLAADL